MSAKEIGEKLVAYCKQGKNADAINELYADNVVSVEAAQSPAAEMPRELNGKEAILGKNKWWSENHEVHSAEVNGPFPHGDNKFAVQFNYDVTFKPASQRMQMNEIAVYEVQDGKVAREEFFYAMG
ncbi:MAG: nuclear transport factor 2 family protein [Deltaproteobacteria bacterium]|nr:nuclear transport factor 2 family protein [Deltaproteobacteria bacterium]